MASVEVVIKALIARIEKLEARVKQLEDAADATDEWITEIDVDLGEDLDDLDPGERAAVEAARRRLQADKGAAINEQPPSEVQLDTGDGGSQAWFPVPTDEQTKLREAMLEAGAVGLEELEGIEYDEAQRGWLIGGPLWLHAYDRDHVMSLPVGTRRAFVADVEESSTRDAHELSRDILKSEGPGTPEVFMSQGDLTGDD